jgi:sugar (pentulose or hexulose) kinase
MNRKTELILSIDAGTQSIRSALVDVRGNIRHIVKVPIEPYFSEHPGWAEQDPDYYWKMLCLSCRQVLQKAGTGALSALKGVTLTTQRATMINVDENGSPLRPAIIWLDQRKADSRKILPGFARPLLRAANLLTTVEEAVRNCEANWIVQNQPQIWKKTHRYLLLSGFFTHRLTGEFVDSTGNNVGYLPFDKKTYDWAGDLDFKWRLFKIEREKLPRLVKPASVLGQVTARASRETGIPRGLPVVAAGTDKGCEILGAGCLTPETGCLSFGTTATFNVTMKKYVELFSQMPQIGRAHV